jgi:LysR family transcriptional regulator, mexEF-oprN operon transcriptional activator
MPKRLIPHQEGSPPADAEIAQPAASPPLIRLEPEDFWRFDLNLLLVFEAMMREQQVTRAAQRLGIGQPAMSQALLRLRQALADPLFVRAGHQMLPTQRAQTLAPAIHHALLALKASVLTPSQFDPAFSSQAWHLGLSDFGAALFLPSFAKAMTAKAPAMRFTTRASDRQEVLEALDNGALDLAIGVFPSKHGWHYQQPLWQEEFVCLWHPKQLSYASPMSLELFCEARHILVSLRGDSSGAVDEALAKQKRQRHIAFILPHFLVLPQLLAGAPLIATVPRSLANLWPELAQSPPPMHVEGFTVSMLWHIGQHHAPAHRWLRQEILAVAGMIAPLSRGAG